MLARPPDGADAPEHEGAVVTPSALALVDYGAGNLTSVRKGFAAVGAEIFTPAEPAELDRAAGIVVPGVGHFGATAAVGDRWRTAISEAVGRGLPLFGICLGMQWLYDGSDESIGTPGIGAISGRCSRLDPDEEHGLKVPHVGWNSLRKTRWSRLLEGVGDGAQVYFTHSFAAPVSAATAATCTHGREFGAVVETGHVFGVQFHPEKSGDPGLRILRNFVALARAGG